MSEANDQDLCVYLQTKENREAFFKKEEWGKYRSFKNLMQAACADKKMTASFIVYTIGSTVMALGSVLIIHLLIAAAESQEAGPALLLGMAAAVLLVIFLSGLLSYLQKAKILPWVTYYRMELLNDFFRQMNRMDYGLFESAAFMADYAPSMRALSGSESGVEGFFKQFLEFLRLAPTVLLIALFLLLTDVRLGLAAAALILLSAWAAERIRRVRLKFRSEKEMAERQLSVYNQTIQDFSYGKDIRLFQMEDMIRRALLGIIDKLKKIEKKIAVRAFGFDLIDGLGLVSFALLSFVVLGAKVHAGTLSAASFMSLVVALNIFFTFSTMLIHVIRRMDEEMIDVAFFWAVNEKDLSSSSKAEARDFSEPVTVAFEHVSFTYPGTKKPVLDDVSFHMDAGEKIALVGVNGAGKSTIIKLLSGLFYPTSGRILIDGIPTTEIRREELERLFGIVFQDSEPIAATVAENVTGSSDEPDEEKLRQVLERVGLWEKVDGFKDGVHQQLLKSIYSDGTVLSGGENQKLMIARALYKEGMQMMIFDEPTSALDALAEERLYREFQEITSGKTTLFISHRLASTRFLDRILLLDGGSIKEEGTHEELLARQGIYARMFETQGKYYRDSKSEDGSGDRADREAGADKGDETDEGDGEKK